MHVICSRCAVALTILCPCLQSHNTLLLVAKEGLLPTKRPWTSMDHDRCHQDREGVGHEVADPEEVRCSVEVLMLDAWWILCFSGEAAKNSEPLDGRPEIHGKIEGHGVISISFPSFLSEVGAKGFSTMVISAMVDSNPVFCIHRGVGGVPCILYFPIMSCIMHV